jgi:hypothetical protein
MLQKRDVAELRCHLGQSIGYHETPYTQDTWIHAWTWYVKLICWQSIGNHETLYTQDTWIHAWTWYVKLIWHYVLRFSISASLSRTLLPASTDIESDCCGICVVSPHSQSLHLSVYFRRLFSKRKETKLNNLKSLFSSPQFLWEMKSHCAHEYDETKICIPIFKHCAWNPEGQDTFYTTLEKNIVWIRLPKYYMTLKKSKDPTHKGINRMNPSETHGHAWSSKG